MRAEVSPVWINRSVPAMCIFQDDHLHSVVCRVDVLRCTVLCHHTPVQHRLAHNLFTQPLHPPHHFFLASAAPISLPPTPLHLPDAMESSHRLHPTPLCLPGAARTSRKVVLRSSFCLVGHTAVRGGWGGGMGWVWVRWVVGWWYRWGEWGEWGGWGGLVGILLL